MNDGQRSRKRPNEDGPSGGETAGQSPFWGSLNEPLTR
jgi:hypothetical protein